MPERLFEEYRPSNLLDIYETRGTIIQLFLYYAILADLKPAMDDWIYVDRLDAFIEACEKLSLLVEVESVFFDEGMDRVRRAIGSESLTTTVAHGAPLESGRYGRAHVYISKSREGIENLRRTGWYPLAVNNRIITKPQIDFYWFGIHLGYPQCCIDFFASWNNHSVFPNTLLKPFENTGPNPNFLCNSLVKDSYSYLYHIPCSFDCETTASLSARLRDFIMERDPGYAQYIDRHLKLNFLVFRERDIYAFDGSVEDGVLKYDNCYFVDDYLYPGELIQDFHRGDTIIFEEDRLHIQSDGTTFRTVGKTDEQPWFFISFND